MTLPERITKRIVVQPDGCWRWTGGMNGLHGVIKVGETNQSVRRLTYEDLYGPTAGKLLQRCAMPSCVNPEHMVRAQSRERFWALVDKNGPVHPIHGRCWIWLGGRSSKEYGSFRDAGVQRGAHQVAFELDAGRPIKKGAVILHKCDRRECVRPAHLVEGTQLENIQDAAQKGRRATGERHPSARLTEEAVREIRRGLAAGEKQITLARRHGITAGAVRAIIRGDSWKHVH